MKTGIVIVDHGSRRAESNRMLEEVAALFARRYAKQFEIVEPAHMELAEPSIESAYARCAERGATNIVVLPFFLGPGKHWTHDIPRLTADAARRHPQTRFHVAMPLGIDDLIVDLLAKRAGWCAEHGLSCESCRGTLRSGESGELCPATEEPAKNSSGQCGTCPFVTLDDGTIIDKRKQPAPG
jgi:sirohydrochlorin ferrochelatase